MPSSTEAVCGAAHPIPQLCADGIALNSVASNLFGVSYRRCALRSVTEHTTLHIIQKLVSLVL